MKHSKAVAGMAALGLAVGGTGVAVAAGSGPTRAVIKQAQPISVKINRYIKDGMRWKRDVYHVRHGGKLVLKWNVRTEGPHTFTVVRKKDEPKTIKAIDNCLPKGICGKLAIAHGADPNSEAPPKFLFLENGKGQNTPPKINKPGDSVGIGFTPPGTAYKPIKVKVTAKRGTVLHFMCLIHPQMQAEVVVGP